MHFPNKDSIEKYNQVFDRAKEGLNAKQALAVDHIYGPVMTVAGPGTGKTQLLAVRVGNILRTTDVKIGNVLCMTFTEAGSIAMRERLTRFIGPEAYNAKIFTFHSFCNYIIQENIQYFGGYRNLQIASELELVDIYRELIDSFDDDHPLKRFKGNIYFDTNRLKNLFNTMKQEGWTPEMIEKEVNSLYDFYTERDENGDVINDKFLCKRKQKGKLTGKEYQKGEVNLDKVQMEIDKYEGLVEGAKAIKKYNELLAKYERYDYNDMILWVVEALKENDDLLATYQERFQFILVDEFQDTNGTQNELLFLLADNVIDDRPNIFIVGDDDQSIYRFQGANMNNILDFADKYNPIEVVLEKNYRSTQKILDLSTRLIEFNNERLIKKRPHLTKFLEAERNDLPDNAQDPQIMRFQNSMQEEKWIINDILRKHRDGVPYKDMAILYKKHRLVEDIVTYLSLHNIPINIKKKVNVLDRVEVKQIINILEYIFFEYKKPFSAEEQLFEIMHYDFFDLKSHDIALISIQGANRELKEEDRRWRTMLGNEELLLKAGVSEPQKFLAFSEVVEGWINDIPNYTAQVLFEKILTEGGILDKFLRSEDKAWKLQLINTFFNFIKEESNKQEGLNLIDILDMVEKMKSNNIELPLQKVIFSKDGVNLMTAHGSKGLEFDHVYVINVTSKIWDEKNKANMHNFSFPATLVPVSDQSDIEDDRRLLYVAMTRARNELVFTYSDYDKADKQHTPSRFLNEIENVTDQWPISKVSDEDVLEYQTTLLTYKQKKAQLIDHEIIDKVLETFRMSATSLNKYLRCPLAFYFENILRVPMARKSSNGFGNAIHLALELFFRDIEKSPERDIPPLDKLKEYFQFGMKKFHSHFTNQEFELSTTRGLKLLEEYYNEYQNSWKLPRQFEMEMDIKTEYAGVPISGKIDRIDIYDNHVNVIDYKTGRYDSKKLKPPVGDEDLGGDYWRQVVFYNLLLKGEDRVKYPMNKGYMDFVEIDKDAFKLKDFEVSDFEIDIVADQLKDSYQKIKAHQFSDGCGEVECKWCNFVNENSKIQLPNLEEDEALEIA